MHRYGLFVLLLTALLVGSNASSCQGFAPDSPASPMNWEIGTQDSDNGAPIYYSYLLTNKRSPYDLFVSPSNGWFAFLFNFGINTVPLVGGKNFSTYDNSIIPTANFTCLSDYSGIWGPAYPDFRSVDVRAQYPVEVFIHFSAPTETSYIRAILFIKNIGQTTERIATSSLAFLYNAIYGADVSPVSNEGRYMAMWLWNNNDLGSEGYDVGGLIGNLEPMSIHARGPKARNRRSLISRDFDSTVVNPTYYAELAPGEEMALMFIAAFGRNKSSILKNSAEIDTEPAYIFHDLNADKLSILHNWGGCEVILAPEINVTISPPAQCSTGITSDFTVATTTSRNDLSTGFTHRVVLMAGNQLVPSQSSETLSVPNGAAQVKHQLYYRDCLVKETSFTACGKSAAPHSAPATPAQSPVQTPTKPGSTSGASSLSLNMVASSIAIIGLVFRSKNLTSSLLIVACVLLLNGASAASSCTNMAVGQYGQVLSWEFGMGEGDGTVIYSGGLYNNWWSYYDLYAQINDGIFDNMHNYWINGVPLVGTKNYTGEFANIPTATFVCQNDYSGMWGPAYPDYTAPAGQIRGQFQNLEIYIHYSAPPTTSYLRSVMFIKNTGNAAERVALHGDWSANNYGANVSPLNNGRFYTLFPWLDGDLGQFGDNPAATYTAPVTSLHVAGPNGRETDKQAINDNFNNFYVSPVSYTTLGAGEEMALMYISSFGRNKTAALQNAAYIDSEPVIIFHALNADQLSLIRNWGACQSVLGPDVVVTVTAPSQCSTGLTSDFTVSTVTSRSDFTTDFTHRVISAFNDAEVVPAQTSTTLTVPNDIGPMKHQLWYKQCLIKETEFTSCTTSA